MRVHFPQDGVIVTRVWFGCCILHLFCSCVTIYTWECITNSDVGMDQRYCWYKISQGLVYLVVSRNLWNHNFINKKTHTLEIFGVSEHSYDTPIRFGTSSCFKQSFCFPVGSEAWWPTPLQCSAQFANSRWGIYLFFTYFCTFSFGSTAALHCASCVVVWEVEGDVKRFTEKMRRLYECEGRTLWDLKNNHVYQCSPWTDQRHKATVKYIACTLCSEWEPH